MENSIDYGDLATWFTGIITFFVFVIGAFDIFRERSLRKKLEREHELNSIRSQAEQVSCWIAGEDETLSVAISNQSQLPVYQVIVTVVVIGQEGELRHAGVDHVCIAVVPPGVGYTHIVSDYKGMFRRPGIEIAFRDASGKNWIRKADGDLSMIKISTLAHYDIAIPTDWKFLVDYKYIHKNLG